MNPTLPHPMLIVELADGPGAITLHDIAAILPDATAPQKRSVVYTHTFPTGLTVNGASNTLIGLWLLTAQADSKT